MLKVNPLERLTVEEALRHPWLMASPEELAKRDLTGTLSEIRKFNARRKFRGVAKAVRTACAFRARTLSNFLTPCWLHVLVSVGGGCSHAQAHRCPCHVRYSGGKHARGGSRLHAGSGRGEGAIIKYPRPSRARAILLCELAGRHGYVVLLTLFHYVLYQEQHAPISFPL
jgi:hypothetical protein